MKRKKKKHISDETLDSAIDSALKKNQWKIPTDENEVADAEAWIEKSKIKLPKSLQAPGKKIISEKLDSTSAEVLPLACSKSIEQTLSRAARAKGKLTPEIEEKMQKDRKKAEAELEVRKKGKTKNEKDNR